MRTRHLLAILVLLILSLPASSAQAGGVVTICDEAHLRAVLAGGGTVTFACSGTITLAAEIVISADTTIDGSGQTVTISGNHVTRVFAVNPGRALTLNELTVADGDGDDYGGGIYNKNGILTVSNSIIASNSASVGGGIRSDFGTVNVRTSTFSDNSAEHGGGIAIIYSTANVTNSTFFNNNAVSADGGGILNYGGVVDVNNSTFSGNHGGWGGGWGGGLHNYQGTLIISNSTIFENSAGWGGGLSNYVGTLTINKSTIFENSAGQGGGIRNYGELNVSDSAFFSNNAGSGGGIYNDSYSGSGSIANVTNSTFARNRATGDGAGGGIFNGDTLIVANSTFSGNTADHGSGGGIFTGSYGDAGVSTITNSTFSGNAASAANGIFLNTGTATLKNTIVANRQSGSNCHGAINDGGGNLSYPDATCPGINGNPLLSPLQDNGGPTTTMALGRGSAAIDAGIDAICAAEPVSNLDQRGIVRPQGSHCDIGAVEQEPFPVLPPRLWLPSVHMQ